MQLDLFGFFVDLNSGDSTLNRLISSASSHYIHFLGCSHSPENDRIVPLSHHGRLEMNAAALTEGLHDQWGPNRGGVTGGTRGDPRWGTSDLYAFS